MPYNVKMTERYQANGNDYEEYMIPVDWIQHVTIVVEVRLHRLKGVRLL